MLHQKDNTHQKLCKRSHQAQNIPYLYFSCSLQANRPGDLNCHIFRLWAALD